MTLAEQAWAVLRENDEGIFVKPSQRLYPFQWNWDSAFIALGLAGVGPGTRPYGGAVAPSRPVGRRDGAAHRLPLAAGRLPARAGAMAVGRVRRCAGRPDGRADAAASPRDRDPRPPRGRAGSSLSGGGPAGRRGMARLVRARAPRRRPRRRPAPVGVGRQRTTLRSRARASRHRGDRASGSQRPRAGRRCRAADRPRVPPLPRARRRLSARAATVPRRRSTRRSPTTTFR